MTNDPPEFTRLVPLSRIGAAGLTLLVKASPEECAELARRMDIPAIHALSCAYTLNAGATDPAAIEATGHLRARVTRECVVSAEDFEMDVADDFHVRFVPAGVEPDDADPDDDDEIPYEGDVLDLGEATAEQLGLALDPYPRIEGAVAPEGGPDPSPFAALARLKGPGGGTP